MIGAVAPADTLHFLERRAGIRPFAQPLCRGALRGGRCRPAHVRRHPPVRGVGGPRIGRGASVPRRARGGALARTLRRPPVTLASARLVTTRWPRLLARGFFGETSSRVPSPSSHAEISPRLVEPTSYPARDCRHDGGGARACSIDVMRAGRHA